jgi:hypothetical protein
MKKNKTIIIKPIFKEKIDIEKLCKALILLAELTDKK